MLRQHHSKDPRYRCRVLNEAEKAVVKDRSNRLPSNRWFVAFFKSHPRVNERTPKTKDVQRMAAIKPSELRDDLEAVGKQLCEPDIQICVEPDDSPVDGCDFPYKVVEADKINYRGPGYCSKARLIQVDEKGA